MQELPKLIIYTFLMFQSHALTEMVPIYFDN